MPQKILQIEDDAIIRRAYKTILSREGFEFYEADDGQHGLEKALEVAPDLILLDMMMPNMNGLEFLKAYMPANHPNTKIVVFSNSSLPGQSELALKLGAHRFLTKAMIPPKELVRVVKETLADGAPS